MSIGKSYSDSIKKLAEELGIGALALAVGDILDNDDAPGPQGHDSKDTKHNDGCNVGLHHHLDERDGIVQKNLLKINSNKHRFYISNVVKRMPQKKATPSRISIFYTNYTQEP